MYGAKKNVCYKFSAIEMHTKTAVVVWNLKEVLEGEFCCSQLVFDVWPFFGL